jgi:hypothetical protein
MTVARLGLASAVLLTVGCALVEAVRRSRHDWGDMRRRGLGTR